MLMKEKGFFCTLSMLILLASFLLVTSCHTVTPIHPTAGQQIQSTIKQSLAIDKNLSSPSKQPLPANVNSALLPPLSHYVNPVKQERLEFDVTANNIPAREFFMGLVAGTPVNMVVQPNVNGMISMKLKNVTLEQVMDAVRDIYGYEYHRTSYGYEVLAPELETQLFHVNYIDVQRSGRSYTQLTTGQVSNVVGTTTAGSSTNGQILQPSQPAASSNGNNFPTAGAGTISSIETRSETKFWKDLEKTIQNMIGKQANQSVTVNSMAGVVVVHAYPVEIHRVSRYLSSLQTSLNRQVILEAKIIEITLNDQYKAGVDWSVLANPAYAGLNNTGSTSAGMGQSANSAFPDTELKTLNGIFAIRTKGDFTTLIELLQSQGNVQVLSSPHISTVNNQKAVIKVGSDEFFVTGVSTTNSVVGNNTLPSQNVSLTPFFSGITLDVTPEVSGDNAVILHIHPSVSTVVSQNKVIGLGATAPNTPNTLNLPMAFSTIRESDNIVRAKNGQVVVIGGLMQNVMSEKIIETPWLGKLPFIGAAFRRTEQIAVKSELVILLRPIVANNRAMIGSLEQEKSAYRILKRPFHAGGLSTVFGNEGETADNN